MPNILHPDVGAGREKQPLHWDEKQTHQIGGDGYADEQDRESLAERLIWWVVKSDDSIAGGRLLVCLRVCVSVIITHQSLVFERVIHRTQQQPEWPEKLETELEQKVSGDYERP